jgi:hypothetical protein
LRGQAGQLGLPPGFLVAGQFRHLRQVLAHLRVPGLQQRQQFVADAIAGIGQLLVRRVFSPALAQGLEIGLHLAPRSRQQRAQDAALGKLDHRVDAGKPFGPGAAQKLAQHGFRLIVAGVGGGHGVYFARGHQLPEPAVAYAAGGFLNGLGGLAGGAVGLGLGGNIDPCFVEGQAQIRRQTAGEIQIGVCLCAAQAVVQVDGVQHQAQFPAALGQGAQQGDGVRAAREAHGQPQARPQQRRVHWQA